MYDLDWSVGDGIGVVRFFLISAGIYRMRRYSGTSSTGGIEPRGERCGGISVRRLSSRFSKYGVTERSVGRLLAKRYKTWLSGMARRAAGVIKEIGRAHV